MKIKTRIQLAIIFIFVISILFGCSSPIDDPNDPYIKPTRNYAVLQVKEHYKTDVRPYDIKITKCDYDFLTPYMISSYFCDIAEIRAEYAERGNFKNYEEYSKRIDEIYAKIDTLTNIWMFPDERYAIRGEYIKPLYKCVSPIEVWDVHGKNIDTITFFLRWCGFNPNDTTQIISSMSAINMIMQKRYDDIMYNHGNIF